MQFFNNSGCLYYTNSYDCAPYKFINPMVRKDGQVYVKQGGEMEIYEIEGRYGNGHV